MASRFEVLFQRGFSRRLGQRTPRPSWLMLFLGLLVKKTWLLQSHLGHNPRKRGADRPLLGGKELTLGMNPRSIGSPSSHSFYDAGDAVEFPREAPAKR